MFIKNHWYAVEFGHRVAQGPVLVRIHGHNHIVLWRSRDRAVNAWSDVCVHRGCSLASGAVVDNCLQCPYHGWRYAPNGVCVKIPANSKGVPIPENARIHVYPCLERYGFIWVFLGDLPTEQAPPLPELDGLEPRREVRAKGCKPVFGDFTWKASHERVLENGLDISHAPFVHSGSFGNPDHPEIPDFDLDVTRRDGHMVSVTASVDLESVPPSGFWRLISKRDHPRVPTTVGFYPPNVSMLIVRLPLGTLRLFSAAVPLTEHTTVSKFFMVRSFFTGAWADGDAQRRAYKIFLEDQPIVESLRPPLLPPEPSAELHVKSDAVQLAYRRWRQEQLVKGWVL
ncbi:MAG: aromatic ring-hydroxylating dioxygenase subunit alpha [Synechococcus sp. SB0662_bin_45]|nr:aromatic ring-hydroxylating dioxygenase subunit alpha [Synechococcus sp. SB0668_bin_13]MYE21789.1 aromatic ring-hydroxylating dioxygenase subunit alpha [Synechococcus sp. SB0662_bin_45]